MANNRFEVRVGSDTLSRPHTLLNEAKLTQLALSIRFGATFARLDVSPLKLLVLDDLLISLDMGNRMKVVEIILGPTFAGYQKIILTHDSDSSKNSEEVLAMATPIGLFNVSVSPTLKPESR